MPIVSGRSAAAAPHEILPKSKSDLVDSVALCAQDPSTINDTVQNNILFGRDLYEDIYRGIIAVCNLDPDLEVLRAVYSNARHVFLDDRLGAFDSHTASWIFREIYQKAFMKGRTCALVTHNVALTIPGADCVVKPRNGLVVAAGSPQDLSATGHFPVLSDLAGHGGATQLPNGERTKVQEEPSEFSAGVQQEERQLGNTYADEMADAKKQNESPPGPALLKDLVATGGWLF